MSEADFVEFPKIARWSRDVVITEKIDGTNAQVEITRLPETRVPDPREIAFAWDGDDLLSMRVGSRSRFLTAGDDHFGFARWCEGNAEELFRLGEGRHFGEWWGSGIQRRYGLSQDDKRFSLFNTSRWGDAALRPACCSVVPILYLRNAPPGSCRGRAPSARGRRQPGRAGIHGPRRRNPLPRCGERRLQEDAKKGRGAEDARRNT